MGTDALQHWLHEDRNRDQGEVTNLPMSCVTNISCFKFSGLQGVKGLNKRIFFKGSSERVGNTALVSLSLADQACCCSGVIPSCCHPRRVPLWLPGGWGGEGAESTGAGAGGLAVHRLTRTEPQIEYKFPD